MTDLTPEQIEELRKRIHDDLPILNARGDALCDMALRSLSARGVEMADAPVPMSDEERAAQLAGRYRFGDARNEAKLADAIAEALRSARREGATQMRERIAHICEVNERHTGAQLAEAIHALDP